MLINYSSNIIKCFSVITVVVNLRIFLIEREKKKKKPKSSSSSEQDKEASNMVFSSSLSYLLKARIIVSDSLN